VDLLVTWSAAKIGIALVVLMCNCRQLWLLLLTQLLVTSPSVLMTTATTDRGYTANITGSPPQQQQQQQQQQQVKTTIGSTRVSIENGFVHIGFNLLHPSIDDIRGDFTGNGNYGPNTAARRSNRLHRAGIVLERIWMEADQDIWPIHSASSRCAGTRLHAARTVDTPQRSIVRITGVVDDCEPRWAALNSTWTIELLAGNRQFRLTVDVEATSAEKDIAAVAVSAYLADPFTAGIFDEGTVAVQGSTYPYFPASSQSVPHFYSLGRHSSLALTNIQPSTMSNNISTVLLNSGDGQSWFSSGIQLLLAGSFPAGEGGGAAGAGPGPNRWSNNYQFPTRHKLSVGQRFGLQLEGRPNDKPFPVSTLRSVGGRARNLEGVQAMLMGSFAAAAGCLFSYQSQMALSNNTMSGVALISDEQLHPRRSNYRNLYNFWDPSGFFHVSNLLASGDVRLITDVRRILDTVANAQLATTGMLPHHFQGSKPVYTAISGATLPATNLFWVKAALRYVSETADVQWLHRQLPVLDAAGRFLLNMISGTKNRPQLLRTTGALMIDVFKRSNYTTDANALAVDVFHRLAKMWTFVGNATNANTYRESANAIVSAMNTLLWSTDHFVTQLNPDGTSTDFVDYDSNLLATAFVPMPMARKLAVLRRIDSGNCTHAAPGTYISEKLYGADDVYHCDSDKPHIACVGDSRVSYARVAWLDAISRKVVGDFAAFEELVIEPMRKEVFDQVWTHERYTCRGTPVHSPLYYEYPEVLATITRDVRYGVQFGLGTFTLDPFDRDPFSWHIGELMVDYNAPSWACWLVPAKWQQLDATITGLQPNAVYRLNTTRAQVQSNAEGVARVTVLPGAYAGSTCLVLDPHSQPATRPVDAV
jgi:hypothetical protein